MVGGSGGGQFKVPDPEQAQPAPKAQRNFTDPESRIQQTADGFIQGYTAVLAVDDVAQVIVAQHVTPRGPEVQELLPAVEMIERLLGEYPEQVVADEARRAHRTATSRTDPGAAQRGRAHAAQVADEGGARGVERVGQEWSLVCTARNLLKLRAAWKPA